MRLEGKVALVTGAASGIGAATAELFVKEGARVVLADRNLDQARRVAAALGERALAVGADVVVSQQIRDAVGATISAFGGLDILVNNAGLGIRGTVVAGADLFGGSADPGGPETKGGEVQFKGLFLGRVVFGRVGGH